MRHVVQSFLLKHVTHHPDDLVQFTQKKLSVSKTTVLRHIQHLVNDNLLIKTGTTKGTIYSLTDSLSFKLQLKLEPKQDEFEIWTQYFIKPLQHFSPNTIELCEYVFTELVNNAYDHSNGSKLEITLNYHTPYLHFTIKDNGIGIFNKISRFLQLEDMREAVLQLSKGKLTTDSANHTGEGLFFSSRIVNTFVITANGIRFTRMNDEDDWYIESCPVEKGSQMGYAVNKETNKNLMSLFKQYQDDNYRFNKTEVIVKLSQLGVERFVSRSQAKRVLSNLESFDIIIFDFKHVQRVGQGFADEVFRVYQAKNPNKLLKCENMNDDVRFMIERSRGGN